MAEAAAAEQVSQAELEEGVVQRDLAVQKEASLAGGGGAGDGAEEDDSTEVLQHTFRGAVQAEQCVRWTRHQGAHSAVASVVSLLQACGSASNGSAKFVQFFNPGFCSFGKALHQFMQQHSHSCFPLIFQPVDAEYLPLPPADAAGAAAAGAAAAAPCGISAHSGVALELVLGLPLSQLLDPAHATNTVELPQEYTDWRTAEQLEDRLRGEHDKLQRETPAHLANQATWKAESAARDEFKKAETAAGAAKLKWIEVAKARLAQQPRTFRKDAMHVLSIFDLGLRDAARDHSLTKKTHSALSFRLPKLQQLLKAIQTLHKDLGIVHRNLRSKNILVVSPIVYEQMTRLGAIVAEHPDGLAIMQDLKPRSLPFLPLPAAGGALDPKSIMRLEPYDAQGSWEASSHPAAKVWQAELRESIKLGQRIVISNFKAACSANSTDPYQDGQESLCPHRFRGSMLVNPAWWFQEKMGLNTFNVLSSMEQAPSFVREHPSADESKQAGEELQPEPAALHSREYDSIGIFLLFVSIVTACDVESVLLSPTMVGAFEKHLKDYVVHTLSMNPSWRPCLSDCFCKMRFNTSPAAATAASAISAPAYPEAWVEGVAIFGRMLELSPDLAEHLQRLSSIRVSSALELSRNWLPPPTCSELLGVLALPDAQARIDQNLGKLGLRRVAIQGRGDCLFHAIAHQFQQLTPAQRGALSGQKEPKDFLTASLMPGSGVEGASPALDTATRLIAQRKALLSIFQHVAGPQKAYMRSAMDAEHLRHPSHATYDQALVAFQKLSEQDPAALFADWRKPGLEPLARVDFQTSGLLDFVVETIAAGLGLRIRLFSESRPEGRVIGASESLQRQPEINLVHLEAIAHYESCETIPQPIPQPIPSGGNKARAEGDSPGAGPQEEENVDSESHRRACERGGV